MYEGILKGGSLKLDTLDQEFLLSADQPVGLWLNSFKYINRPLEIMTAVPTTVNKSMVSENSRMPKSVANTT